jgi:hypothetical protein
MRWVTRERCHVDRAACAWLIRRFIDPDATFLFVSDPGDVPPDATPFDIAAQPFSHHDGLSTFEVMVRHHDIRVPGIEALGRIVHEADIEDERYDAPEAPGLDAIVRGLGALLDDDDRLLAVTATLFDGLLTNLANRR